MNYSLETAINLTYLRFMVIFIISLSQIEGKGYECSNTTNPNGYVGSYECVNQDYKESLLSFPSGHTSLITYAMVYGAGYLQLRMPRVRRNRSLVPSKLPVL